MKLGPIRRATPLPLALVAVSCATTSPPKPAREPGTIVADGPATTRVMPAMTPAVTVTPAKTPTHFRNARAYGSPTDKAWLTMSGGITLLVEPYKAPHIEGGEAVWELKVFAFPREGQNIVVAKSDQYGVRIANALWPRPNAEPGTFTFRAVLRAPIECSSETVDTEAHVVLEYVAYKEKRVREAYITLDDLCVQSFSKRPFLDPNELLGSSD